MVVLEGRPVRQSVASPADVQVVAISVGAWWMEGKVESPFNAQKALLGADGVVVGLVATQCIR